MNAQVENQSEFDVTGQIIAFESGELDDDEIAILFDHLVKTGMINHLQGFYQRTAHDMIESGQIPL